MAQQPGGGWWARLREAARDSGPGWLLSAYTLGSGSAIGSLWAGAQYGYQLLWVQPLSMLMGVLVLSGAAYVFVNTKERPYVLFSQVSRPLALAWALGSLFASIIWHFPQYGLAYEAARELLGAERSAMSMVALGGLMLAAMIALTWSYGRGRRGVAVYETAIKAIVWIMVICLAAVVVMVDVDWAAALSGLFVWRLPADNMDLFYGMLSAAVGINMTFLYPYSVRGKEWETEGEQEGYRIAVRDLIVGMFLPYVVATGLMVLATAATLHATGTQVERGNIEAMGQVFAPLGAEWLFYLGLLAMPLSSITLHMLTCGFILSEMTNQPMYGKTWKLGTLVPAIGVLGVGYHFPAWLPVSASALTLVFLPIAYVGFTLLFKRALEREGTGPRPRWLLWPMLGVVVVISWLAVQKVIATVVKLASG